jgi:hypothetical protein
VARLAIVARARRERIAANTVTEVIVAIGPIEGTDPRVHP